jgi:hypothetical protein
MGFWSCYWPLFWWAIRRHCGRRRAGMWQRAGWVYGTGTWAVDVAVVVAGPGLQGVGTEAEAWDETMQLAGKMADGMAVCSAAGQGWVSASRRRSLLGHWDILVVAWAIFRGTEMGSEKVGSG